MRSLWVITFMIAIAKKRWCLFWNLKYMARLKCDHVKWLITLTSDNIKQLSLYSLINVIKWSFICGEIILTTTTELWLPRTKLRSRFKHVLSFTSFDIRSVRINSWQQQQQQQQQHHQQQQPLVSKFTSINLTINYSDQ